MYHAACKVEFQPFKRLYSQPTFFSTFYKKIHINTWYCCHGLPRIIYGLPCRWVLLYVETTTTTGFHRCHGLSRKFQGLYELSWKRRELLLVLSIWRFGGFSIDLRHGHCLGHSGYVMDSLRFAGFQGVLVTEFSWPFHGLVMWPFHGTFMGLSWDFA